MTTTVVLMADGPVGLETTRQIVAMGDRITRLYLHQEQYCKLGNEIVLASGVESDQIFTADLLKDPDHLYGLEALASDFIVTVYWRHLLSPRVIRSARRGTVNFHPALLPVNRGWYPHVHSLIDGSPTGVTLHAIDGSADTGPIWAQRAVPLELWDTAFSIYRRLGREIVQLFAETWPHIKSGELNPTPQDESCAVYHSIREIDALDELDPQSTMTVEALINLLRARSFGHLGFAHYKDPHTGEKIYLNLRLSPTREFGEN